MADIQIKALVDFLLQPDKKSKKRFEKELGALLNEAKIPQTVIDVDPKLKINPAQLRRQLAKVEDTLSKYVEDVKEGGRVTPESKKYLEDLERQRKLLTNIVSLHETIATVDNKQIRDGQRIIEQLQAQDRLWQELTEEQQRAVRLARQYESQVLSQFQALANQAKKLGPGNALIAPQLAEVVDQTKRRIKEVDGFEKEHAKVAEARAKALAEAQAAASKEAADAEKQALKDTDEARKENDRKERERLKQQDRERRERDRQLREERERAVREEEEAGRRRQQERGRQYLAMAGGLDGVSSIDRPQLVDVTAYLKSERDALERQVKLGKDELGRTLSGEQLDVAKRKLLEYSSALKDARNQMNGFGRASRELDLFFRQVLRLGFGFGAVFMIVDGLRALVTSLIDLDAQLKSIQAVTFSTDAQMQQVGNAIRNVATTTKFSINEIAKATQTLAQAGVKPEEITGVLKSVATFASATEASIETAADLVTTMRDVFKELSDETIANQLTQAVNISKTSAEDLRVIFNYGAQTAKQMGLSSEQFLAAVSTLRNAGLRASTVGTGLRQAMLEILSPDTKTLEALRLRYKALGEAMTQEMVKARFNQLALEDNPLVATLKELRRLGINEGDGRLQFQRIFDIRAQNALSALISNLDELEKAESQISFGNAAMEASATQMESLKNSAKNLGAAFTVMTDSIAGGAIPVLEDMADAATDAVQGITRLNDELKASNGIGLGSLLMMGTGAGVLTGLFSRGRTFARVGKGAVGGALAAGAGYAALEEGEGPSESGFKAMLAAATTSVVTSILPDLLRRRRGINERYVADERGERRLEDLSEVGGSAGDLAMALVGASAIKDFVKSVAHFFGKVGGVVTGALSKLPVLKNVGLFLSRFNPWVGGITALLAIITAGYKFFGKEDPEGLKKQFDQAISNFNNELTRYREQLKELETYRLGSLETAAAEGTAADTLDTLRKEQAAVDAAMAEFFGGKVKDVEEVRHLFDRLATEGAVDKSDAQKALIKELAQTQGVDPEALLGRSRDVGRLAERSHALNNHIEGFQEQLVAMVERLREIPEEDLTEVQRSILEYVELQEGTTAKFYAGLRRLDPAEVVAEAVSLFQYAYEKGKAAVDAQKPSLDGAEQRLFALLEDGQGLDQAELKTQLEKLIDQANQAEVSVTSYINELYKKLQDAEKQIIGQRDQLGRKKISLFGFEIEVGSGGAGNGLLAGTSAESLTAQGRQRRSGAYQSSRDVLTDLQAQNLQAIAQQSLQTKEAQKLFAEQLADLYRNDTYGFRNLVANGGPDSELRRVLLQSGAIQPQTDRDREIAGQNHLTYRNNEGALLPTALYNDVEDTVKRFLEMNAQAFTEMREYRVPFETRQRQQQIEGAIQREQERNNYPELRKLYEERVGIQRGLLQDEREHLEAQLRDLSGDEYIRVSNRIDELKLQEEQLEIERQAQLRQLARDEAAAAREQRDLFLENRKKELERGQALDLAYGQTTEYAEKQAELDALFEKQLAIKEAELRAQNKSEAYIQAYADESRKLYESQKQQVARVREVIDSLSAYQAANDATMDPTKGSQAQTAYFNARGGQYSREERMGAIQQYIALQQMAVKALQREQATVQKGTVQWVEYENAIRTVNVRLAEANAALNNLRDQTSLDTWEGVGGEISDGFNLEGLIAGFENAEAAALDLSTSIRDTLVHSLDGVGQAWMDAMNHGEDFEDSIKQILNNVGAAFAAKLIDKQINDWVVDVLESFQSKAAATATASGLSDIGPEIASAVGAPEDAEDAKEMAGEFAKTTSKGREFFASFKDGVSDIVQSSRDTLGGIFSHIKGGFGVILQGASSLFQAIAAAAKASTAGDSLIGTIASLFSGTPQPGDSDFVGPVQQARRGASDLRRAGGGLLSSNGGVIRGPGGPTGDKIPAVIFDSKTGRPTRRLWVSDEESVLNARATRMLGRETIDAINNLQMAPLRRAAGGMLNQSYTMSQQASPGTAGAGVKVELFDQRSGGEDIQPEVTRGPNGETLIRAIIRDEVASGMAAGRFDKALRHNYGINRTPRRR